MKRSACLLASLAFASVSHATLVYFNTPTSLDEGWFNINLTTWDTEVANRDFSMGENGPIGDEWGFFSLQGMIDFVFPPGWPGTPFDPPVGTPTQIDYSGSVELEIGDWVDGLLDFNYITDVDYWEGDKYFGFFFVRDDGVRYGWMEFSIASESGPLFLEVIAYESEPGVGVTVGVPDLSNPGENDPAVPEPAAVGLLGMVTVLGALALRRRR